MRAVGFIIFSLCKADRERRAGCWAVGIAVGNKGLFSHFLYFCLWAGWGTSGENLTWNRSSIFKLELDSPAERGLLTPQLSVTLGHSAEAAHARQPWGCHISPGQIWRGHYYSKPLISLPSDILVPGAGCLLDCPPGLVNILKKWHTSSCKEGMVFTRHGVRTPGSYTFSSSFWLLWKFCVSCEHRAVSVCETLLVVCYLQEDFLLARRILQSRSANFSLEELWFQYKSLNLFRWVCFQQGHRISSHLLKWGDEWIQLSCILRVPSPKWTAELIISSPLAPASSVNCSFFQSWSEKCWSATAPLQVSLEGQGATSLNMYQSHCPAWKWGCQSLYSRDSAGMWFFSCNFSWKQWRISAKHCWREEGRTCPPWDCWSVDVAARACSWY